MEINRVNLGMCKQRDFKLENTGRLQLRPGKVGQMLTAVSILGNQLWPGFGHRPGQAGGRVPLLPWDPTWFLGR